MRRVEFLTRAGCSLCDDGRAKIGRVAGLLGIEVADVDVDADPSLQEAYGGRVPVVLGPGGEVVAEGRLTAGGATAALLRLRLGVGGGPGPQH